MKKIYFVLVMVLLLFTTGCRRTRLTEDGLELVPVTGEVIDYWHGLSLYVDPDSVTPTGAQLSTINDGPNRFSRGVALYIHQLIDGRWYHIPELIEFDWAMPELFVEPNSVEETQVGWERRHGELAPGTYRIIREFSNGMSNATLYAIFEITE